MPFTQEQIRALQDLAGSRAGDKLVLVGASALGCFLDMEWRQTHDLDVSVAVSVNDQREILGNLSGWTKDPKQEPRWFSPLDVKVDVIPAGPMEMAAGRLVWPETQMEMTLTGFRLAFERAIPIAIGNDDRVKAAPPEVVVLLKMVAYQDRPRERKRDLEDIAYVLDRRISPDAEERFTDEIIKSGLTYETTSPYLVGRRISDMVNPEERLVVSSFLEKVRDENDTDLTQVRMATKGPWHGNPQEMLRAVRAFERGFAHRP